MKGLHHLHLRKRKKRGLEPYPAHQAWLRLLDRLVLAVGVIGPLSAIPQILKIYALRDATGVSMLSWALPAIMDIPWIVYGLVHRETPIVVTYSLWFAANVIVAVGVLMYGTGPLY